MTDALHQGGARPLGKGMECRIALGALTDAGAHLDELVIIERAIELGHHAVGEPRIAHDHERVQRMGESAQVLALLLGEGRGHASRGRGAGSGLIIVTPMPKRTKSSARWLAEHASDEYVKRAQREGFRSRAVYKLAEIQSAERILRPGMRVLDLGAAPGGWSQYAARLLGPAGRIVATDLLPMEPIAGVEFVQGDFREESVLQAVLERVGASRVDLVLSDMAPNMAGIDAVDQPRALYLAELALELCDRVLAPGGDALVKLFQGAGFQELVRDARARFGRVSLKKPKASRARSPEIYLLARQFRMV